MRLLALIDLMIRKKDSITMRSVLSIITMSIQQVTSTSVSGFIVIMVDCTFRVFTLSIRTA